MRGFPLFPEPQRPTVLRPVSAWALLQGESAERTGQLRRLCCPPPPPPVSAGWAPGRHRGGRPHPECSPQVSADAACKAETLALALCPRLPGVPRAQRFPFSLQAPSTRREWPSPSERDWLRLALPEEAELLTPKPKDYGRTQLGPLVGGATGCQEYRWTVGAGPSGWNFGAGRFREAGTAQGRAEWLGEWAGPMAETEFLRLGDW